MRQPKKHALAPLISLQKLSQNSNSIANLIQMANNRKTLDDTLNQCLPIHLKDQFKANSLNDCALVLTCSSAKVMTKFRFVQDEVLSHLNELLAPHKILSIQIKIRPNLQFKPELNDTKKPCRTISKKNAQVLLEEAEHTVDQNLKNILTNLAKHADQ